MPGLGSGSGPHGPQGTIARGRPGLREQAHRLGGPVNVEVSQASPTEVDADLLVVGLHEEGDLPAGLKQAPGAGDAKGGFKKLTPIYPERPGRGAGRRPRQARRDGRREGPGRGGDRGAGGGQAGGDLDRLAPAPARRRRDDRRGGRDRHDPRLLPLRPLPQRRPGGPAAAGDRVPRAARAARSRRGGRGGPRLRRGPEPGPRPAEPAVERRHALLPGRASRGDRRGARGGQRRGARPQADREKEDGRPRRRQPGERGAAAADRPALRGRRRRARRSAWSARASPSTPAASRSSPPPGCTR